MCAPRWLATVLSLALISSCGGGGDSTGTISESSEAVEASSTTEGPDAVEPEPWGESAVDWWDAMGTALDEGPENLVSFLASDLVWEDRVLDQVTNTEEEWVDAQLAANGRTYAWIDPAMLVSADEILGSFTGRAPNGMFVDGLDRMVIGPDGVSHWVTGFGPVELCRAYVPWMCESDIDGLVDRYLTLWTGTAGVEVDAIYAPYAVLSDTLLGEKLSGSDAVAGAIGFGAWPTFDGMTVPTLSEKWGRAVYLAPCYHDWVEGPAEVRFLVDVDDGSGCPGRMGVALALEGERVIWEHRYHDIESVRRCYDPADLQRGWWEDMVTPETIVVEQTGTVSYGDMTVDVYNGIAELDEFVRWGLSRFEQAGLAAPHIDSVAFIRARVYCHDVAGQASISTEETSIVLCFTPAEVCVDDSCALWSMRSRHYWLHELAHPWLDEFADDEVRSEFLDLFGLPKWSDLDDPWRQRGVERAADVLAHSLMDETVTLYPQINESCLLRDSGFHILTGSVPLVACVDAGG